MSNWVFNSELTKEFEQTGDKVRIVIQTSSFQIAIRKKDPYVLMKGRYSRWKPQQDLIIENTGRITNVSDPKKIETFDFFKNPIKTEYQYTLQLAIEKTIEKYKNLDDYTYSLLSIYRYLTPQVHFNQQYRKIRDEDYETLFNEQIYYARTAFGRLINAIPRENKFDFLIYARDRFDKIKFTDIDYIEALNFLEEYIDQNILSQGRYLVETAKMLKEHFHDVNIPINEIGFADIEEDGEKNVLNSIMKKQSDELIKQADYFQELFGEEENAEKERDNKLIKSDSKIMISDKIKAEIQQHRESEERFDRLFKKTEWPIDLAV